MPNPGYHVSCIDALLSVDGGLGLTRRERSVVLLRALNEARATGQRETMTLLDGMLEMSDADCGFSRSASRQRQLASSTRQAQCHAREGTLMHPTEQARLDRDLAILVLLAPFYVVAFGGLTIAGAWKDWRARRG